MNKKLIRFNNDYNHMAHESVLAAMAEIKEESYGGYGVDEWCDAAAEDIRKLSNAPDADIWFFPGATQANLVVVSSTLTSIQSVISATTGHINAHEAASIENTGHKILELPETDGKISAEQIDQCAGAYYQENEAEFLTEPKMVYISFPTEKGTLYSLEEVEKISAVCRKYNMYLFVDGARMGYGLGSEKNDITLEDFARLADVFYIGGTKCGAMFGEAVVINNSSLKRRFKAYMKQAGAVLAKGWLLGLQFHALLENGTYFEITKRADELAMRIKAAFLKKGIQTSVDSYTNQQFVILSDSQMEKLAPYYTFEVINSTPEGKNVRFCTSWATTEEEVERLISDIEKL